MKQKIFDVLDELQIPYTNYEHAPVFTCDEAKGVDIPWYRVKSLLLRNKKSTNSYMVVLPDSKKLDTNIIRYHFSDSKLSFASEELMMQKIGLKPWSVSPFALINNTERDIRVIFDTILQNQHIWLHPLQNDNTVIINTSDIEKFLHNLWFSFSFLKF